MVDGGSHVVKLSRSLRLVTVCLFPGRDTGLWDLSQKSGRLRAGETAIGPSKDSASAGGTFPFSDSRVPLLDSSFWNQPRAAVRRLASPQNGRRGPACLPPPVTVSDSWHRETPIALAGPPGSSESELALILRASYLAPRDPRLPALVVHPGLHGGQAWADAAGISRPTGGERNARPSWRKAGLGDARQEGRNANGSKPAAPIK